MLGYSYMIIRLTPSLENEEFANVGILLLCEKLNFLKVKILDRLTDRIKKYFSGVQNKNYLKATANIVETISGKTSLETANGVFAAFSQSVLGLLSFGDVRLLVSEKQPEDVLQELFSSFVQTGTENVKVGRQRQMEQTIVKAFSNRQWFHIYRQRSFVNKRGYNLELRFVAEKEKCVLPLNLDYKDVKIAVDRTCLWSNRLRMFTELLPPKIILPYRLTINNVDIKETAMDFIQAQDKDRVEAVDIEDADRLENAMAI